MGDSDIQVVCFDLGGVLIRCVNGWGSACKRAGVPIREEGLLALKGHQGVADANNMMEEGKVSARKFMQVLALVTGYQPQEIFQIVSSWFIELYPGVDELLQELSEAGIRLAALTNTNDVHFDILNEDERFAAIPKFIPDIFASHIIGVRKPDFEAFEHVEFKLNVDPDQILFFDDVKENVEAAIHHDWKAVQIDSNNDPAAQILAHTAMHGLL
ncbi:MAG: HAD-IA family hydrolase [Phycisphaera sp.]|nr:HAD-IA family hydrolase [Phycisphaera sp.]